MTFDLFRVILYGLYHGIHHHRSPPFGRIFLVHFFPSASKKQIQVSNEIKPGCLVYIGDFTTQLYRDYNKPIKGSLLNNHDSMESKGPHVFFVAQVTIVCLTGEPGFAQCSATGETFFRVGGWLVEGSPQLVSG